ncbi:type III polyketide synthase [Terriglobus sp. TAA 43]|uniref:type III polyketide synthase n=1 Tax=Terriglobus sp. TAA 43 TaxID=278961 RepID=UPI0006483F1D|nr:type III polyketide synthase [Terriglobus sp. TAA 43]
MRAAYIQRVATAVPDHNVHHAFVSFAGEALRESREQALFKRMAERSGIDSRYSVLSVQAREHTDDVSAYEWYRERAFPSTAERMQLFEQSAPILLRRALDNLNLTSSERQSIKHVIVTCCTGHYAPGLDFTVIEHLGLDCEASRTMIGFMGCYAAVNGLRQAQSIVRSAPDESVLLVNLELCSLHLQETKDLGEMLAFLIFADGCAATLISSQKAGFAIDSFRSLSIPDSRDLITWRVGNNGFLMHLSGKVPPAIESFLREERNALPEADEIALWAIHPGGKTVLDAVERGLSLTPESLAASREVLRRFGNMSSSTVMFVLKDLMQCARSGDRGVAMAFGPGLTAETMRFHAV